MGEVCEEYYVHHASTFLRMSYAELDDHPKKYELMRKAFTLKFGIADGNEMAAQRAAMTKGNS